MIRFVVSLLSMLALAVLSTTAQAARRPDIVEKEFVIEGDAAIDVMNFLGFPSGQDIMLKLPWKKDTSMCLVGNGQERLCDPIVRVNTLTFKMNKTPRIKISGYWFDGETGNLADVPKYSFQSPDLDSADLSDWAMVVSKHSKALASGNKSAEINTEGVPLVRITSYEFQGHTTYSLGIDDRSPVARRVAAEKEAQCLKRLQQSGSDGGC